jgi:peptidyl-prolyl cis-trans isomerase B (cyclophilin B)
MKTFLPAIILILSLVGVIYFVMNGNLNPNPAPNSSNSNPSSSTSATPQAEQVATIELEKGGIIKIRLLPQIAPKTVTNFTGKANASFYDNLTFHRVEDWVVQGGDPLGNGTGGDNNLATEAQTGIGFKLGAVGVARASDPRVSNNAQFFIVKKDSDFLDGAYTLFGQVIEGMDVVQAIQIGDKIRRIRVQ